MPPVYPYLPVIHRSPGRANVSARPPDQWKTREQCKVQLFNGLVYKTRATRPGSAGRLAGSGSKLARKVESRDGWSTEV